VLFDAIVADTALEDRAAQQDHQPPAAHPRAKGQAVRQALPASLPRKQVLALCGAAAALLVVMGVGISVLFKLTGSSVKEAPGTVVETVAPLPDLYVD
jgi:hypothetical protein